MERLAYAPKEASELLSCSRSKLYELIASGNIRAMSLGRRTLIARAELERFIESLPLASIRQSMADASTERQESE